MKCNFGTVVIVAGFAGILSFSFLAAAIGSEYWYIIEVNKPNQTDTDDLNSHSGLWRTYEGKNGSSHDFYPFSDSTNYTETERRLLGMHRVIVILLPLSLVLLVFGGICGLVSSLARSHALLTVTASYFLLCSLLTLSGVSLYISYSHQALEEIKRQVGAEQLAGVQVCFGWSLGVAVLSFSLEVITGALLLQAGRMARLQQSSTVCTAVVA